MKTFGNLILVWIFYQSSYSDPKYFEGIVTYNFKEFDSKGNILTTPINKERFFFKKGIILNEIIDGIHLLKFGNEQVYIDTEKKIRLVINNDQKFIKNIGIETVIQNVNAIEEKKLNEEKVLGHPCNVTFLKYVHKFMNPFGKEVSDTLSCTYYTSKQHKIFQPEVYGLIQGNRNSLVLDGRFKGIPLRVIIRRTDNSNMIIESSGLKETKVDDFIKLPSYPLNN